MVSADDIRDAADKYFRIENRSVIEVVPVSPNAPEKLEKI